MSVEFSPSVASSPVDSEYQFGFDAVQAAKQGKSGGLRLDNFQPQIFSRTVSFPLEPQLQYHGQKCSRGRGYPSSTGSVAQNSDGGQ
uniref:Uncharacterized protein n=1 Tax=Caenorhabditis tropicalis TaxID=1561998 RepID=A0A1I7T052_9PELO